MKCDVCIVGAGVVGLAVARELGQRLNVAGPGADARVCLLEQERSFGEHSSSRNSEVIHGGLYYAPGSLKATLCLRGREQLYAYCQRYQIPHHPCGKLIVAQSSELPALEQLYNNAIACGVDAADLRCLDGAQLSRLEPAVQARQAILSTRTGIINSHALMQQLLSDAQAHDVVYAPQTRVTAIRPLDGGGFDVALCSGSNQQASQLHCRWLVNCAGLQAGQLAQRIEGLALAQLPRLEWIKGSYFSYRGRSPLKHLVYPLPELSGRGLGIHATLDLQGRLRFGPDTEAVQTLDYRVDEARRQQFVSAIRRYLPSVDAERLQPDYAGIRSRIATPGQADFSLVDGTDHNMPGLLQLFGIESPGLTASLALAVMVAGRVRDQYC